jgi:hypothetical protein
VATPSGSAEPRFCQTAEEIQECFVLFDQCCEFLTGPNTSGAFACAAEVSEDLSVTGLQSAA